MLQYFQYRWRIWRLERRARADERGTIRAVEAAKREGASPTEISEITGGSDAGVIRHRIHEAMSRYLTWEAHRLVVPLPDENDKAMWMMYSDGDCEVLSRKGVNELRAAIRAEKKARQDRFLIWVPGVVGILGAAIGLASILLGKGK